MKNIKLFYRLFLLISSASILMLLNSSCRLFMPKTKYGPPSDYYQNNPSTKYGAPVDTTQYFQTKYGVPINYDE